ncbi:hypothetical protein [Microbispora sp. CA-102843]|uniref:hypothetical protein n=1 Tax=Microbispora sp. CA-102843 TaxID=3239952 RepID=UPI003D8A303A
MPNKPRTQHRSVRVDDPEWADLDAAAQLDDSDRAKIINAYIAFHLRRPGAELPPRPTEEQMAEIVARREASAATDS